MSSWAIDHAGMRVLSDEDCATLLGSRQVGRVAFLLDGEVEIFPVAFVLDGSAVAFRSTIGTKLAATLDHATVAFEVDRFEPASRAGWSVVVKGTCEEVHDEAAQARLDSIGFRTWIERPETESQFRWVRIRPYSITGRALPPHPA